QALVESLRAARANPEQLAYESSERYGYPAGFLARYFEQLRSRFRPRPPAGAPRALLREPPFPLRPARARRPLHVPRACARRRRARRGARAALRRGDGRGLDLIRVSEPD